MGIVIIKAAISVFICCLIYLFFDIGTGAPFYSAIAAVICLQPEIKSTFRIGLNRTIGTLIGGFTGMFVLFLIRGIELEAHPVFAYLLISFCIIPLMFLAEIVKKPHHFKITSPQQEEKHPFALAPFKYLVDFMRKNALTNITCIAFLSVTVTHGTDTSISGFALNRMLDTLIGVFVSFFVNIIPIRSQESLKHDMQAATDAACHCKCHQKGIPPAPARDPRKRYIALSGHVQTEREINIHTTSESKTNPCPHDRKHDEA